MNPLPTWSRLSLRAKSLLVLSIPLVALFAVTGAIVLTAGQQRSAQTLVSHTLDVKARLSEALLITIDAEAAIKDYWLSREPEALARFGVSAQAWLPTTSALQALIADNPVQTRHLARALELRTDRPLMQLRDYLSEHPDAASPPRTLLDQSHAIIDGIRREFEDMQRVEDRLLTERVATLRAAEARVRQVAVVGALFGLVGGVVCAVSFSRGISRRIDDVGENAVRLVCHEPLRYVPPSQDEIGRLGLRLEEAWGMTAQRIEAVERARQELDHFFSVTLDLLCIIGDDGRFRRVNPAWATTLGWTPEEMEQMSYADLIHPDDLATVQEGRRQIVSDGLVSVDNRYRCKDGSYRWLSWKTTIPNASQLVFAAARDVTEQRRVTAELHTRVGELRELNDELESFSYSVSHDLRAPLRHVAGFNGLLTRSASTRLTEQERRWLDQSIDAAQRMGRLVDDLLAFSHMGRTALNRQRVSLNDLMREARQEAEGTELTGRRVDWSIGPLPDVQGDAGMLRRVFVNLLDNALKYSSQQAYTTIAVGSTEAREAHAVVFVRDNGVGFDAQYAHKLFGVFQRLHAQEEFSGTGIGLATVRRIVQRHGGDVWAEGTMGGGATFYVSLPLYQREKRT